MATSNTNTSIVLETLEKAGRLQTTAKQVCQICGASYMLKSSKARHERSLKHKAALEAITETSSSTTGTSIGPSTTGPSTTGPATTGAPTSTRTATSLGNHTTKPASPTSPPKQPSQPTPASPPEPPITSQARPRSVAKAVARAPVRGASPKNTPNETKLNKHTQANNNKPKTARP